MKKTYFILAAASMMVAASACTGKTDTTATTETEPATEASVEYTGTTPGADVEGIRYKVILTANGDNAGSYDMTQTYVNGDSIVNSFDSKGDYTVIAKDGAKYIKIGEGAGASYFRCEADTALLMVNSDLEAPAATDDYTLTRTR